MKNILPVTLQFFNLHQPYLPPVQTLHSLLASTHSLWTPITQHLCTTIRPYHSAARAASLVAWSEYKLCLLVHHCPTRYGAGIPGQQLSTHVRCHNSATSAFGGNIATDRTCHPLFNTQRPSVPCRRCSRLECSTAFSVISFVTPYFQTTFKDTSFPTQFLVLVFISF